MQGMEFIAFGRMLSCLMYMWVFRFTNVMETAQFSFPLLLAPGNDGVDCLNIS